MLSEIMETEKIENPFVMKCYIMLGKAIHEYLMYENKSSNIFKPSKSISK